MLVAILLVQAIAFGILSLLVAERKGRSKERWFLIGFLFGIFGFVAALVVGEAEAGNASGPFDPELHEKKCPACAERIKLEARVCRYCGHEFTSREVEQQIENVRSQQQANASDEDTEEPSATEDALAAGLIVVAALVAAYLLISKLAG